MQIIQAMSTAQTETAPSFLQVYTQVRRGRMKHSFLRQITACVDWRGIRTLLNKKYEADCATVSM